jgi:hypothetical protein
VGRHHGDAVQLSKNIDPQRRQREIITNTIVEVRNFRFCGPSDDPDEQTAVTAGFRHLVIQLQCLASPVLPADIASRLNSLDVEINNLYSAYDASSELNTLLPDIEGALVAHDSDKEMTSLRQATPSSHMLYRRQCAWWFRLQPQDA